MHYLDTSVLVTTMTPEPKRTVMLDWIGEHADDCVISDWVLTEFAHAIAAKTRRGELSSADRDSAQLSFDRMIDSQVAVMAVQRRDFRRAATLIGGSQHVLRTGDAIHLAVAVRESMTVVTRDRRMHGCALEAGISAILLGEI